MVSAHPVAETKTEHSILPMASITARTVEYVNTMMEDVQRQKLHAEAVKTGQVTRQYDIERAEENLKPAVCDVTNITNISNLSVDEMKQTFRGTWLEGKEEDLYYFERTYGINVFFIYAVSTLESGRGKSPLARNRQNYYGANLDRGWKDWNDSTTFFCEFITRIYIDRGRISVSDIGPIYCPPNPSWADEIKKLMMGLYESVK